MTDDVPETTEQTLHSLAQNVDETSLADILKVFRDNEIGTMRKVVILFRIFESGKKLLTINLLRM